MSRPKRENMNASERRPENTIDSIRTGVSSGASSGASIGASNGAGMTDEERWRMDDMDYMLLRTAILRLGSVDLLHYRTLQMERRLSSFLERSGQASWSRYVPLLYRKPNELKRFLEFLTINVSSFYRDANKWQVLGDQFLPELLQRRAPEGLAAWSIGCSMGAEPYTLAMLLQEHAPGRPHTIRAGDIDPAVLEVALTGGPYSVNDVRELPQSLTSTYLRQAENNLYWIRTELQRMVFFERFDLLRDKSPHLYDLVICRNLVIYFTTEVKVRVFQQLARTLKPGGILFIGSTETIPNFQDFGLRYLTPSFYRRVI